MTYRLAILVGACLLPPLSAAQAGPAERWKAAMQAAERAEQQPARFGHLKEALQSAEPFGESDPRLLETLIRLASPCDYEGCPDEERDKYLDRALRIRPMSQPADTRLAELLMDLGAAASSQGRHRDALLCYRDALQIREKAFGPSDDKVAKVYVAMAKAYQQQGDKTQARLTMDHALELRDRAGVGSNAGSAEEFAELLEESANLYSEQDQAENARHEYNRVLAVRESLWGKQDSRYIQSMRDIALFMTWQAPEYAENLLKRVVEAERGAEGDESEAHYQALTALASHYTQHKRYDDADRIYQDALAVRSAFGSAGDAEAARCLYSLAAVRMHKGQYDAAIEVGERSLAIRHTLPADPRHETLDVQALLAEAYLEAGEPASAERHYRDFAQTARLQNSTALATTAEKLSLINERLGDYGRAAEKLETVVATLEATRGGDNPELTGKLMRLARLYDRLGRTGDALRVNMRANQIAWKNLFQFVSIDQSGALTSLLLTMMATSLLLAGGGVGGYAWLERRLDRRLSSLYVRVPVDPDQVCEPLPVRRILFHGDGSSLFALRVRNLLLSLLTLGMYSFWGKAKVRRYLCGQAELDDDRLVFHGTGREMLIGWLKGLPIAGFIVLFPNVLPLMWQSPYALAAAQLAALAAIALLWPVARAGSHRYRMNRMSWRGVRFSFRGSTPAFQRLSLSGMALTLLTCGLYYPAFQVRIRRFLFQQSHFGDRPFQFTGRGRDLLPRFLLAVPLTIFTFGLFWAWWSALRHRYFWAHTTFGGARFRCTVTGGRLLRLWFTNGLIVISTVGVGLSWVTVRSARFWSRHIELAGDPDIVTIHQDPHAAGAVGESFADFLGFDFGF